MSAEAPSGFYSRMYGARYDAAEIRAYYEEDYVANLTALPYERAWVLPARTRILKGPEFYENWSGDCFLRQHDAAGDRVGLALDIRDRGTYWPIVGRFDAEGVFLIKEGIHRIYAIGLARERGVWPEDRRLYALDIPDLISLCFKSPNFYDKPEIPLEAPLEIRVPVDPAGQLHQRYGEIYDRLAWKGYDVASKGVLRVECTTYWEATRCYQVFTTYLRDLIFDLHRETEITVEPHPMLNPQLQDTHFDGGLWGISSS